MSYSRGYRLTKLLAAGAIMLQTGGCVFNDFLEFVQTGLLAITAAGGWAIIENI